MHHISHYLKDSSRKATTKNNNKILPPFVNERIYWFLYMVIPTSINRVRLCKKRRDEHELNQRFLLFEPWITPLEYLLSPPFELQDKYATIKGGSVDI